MMGSWQIINSLFYLICAVYLFEDISCLWYDLFVDVSVIDFESDELWNQMLYSHLIYGVVIAKHSLQ